MEIMAHSFKLPSILLIICHLSIHLAPLTGTWYSIWGAYQVSQSAVPGLCLLVAPSPGGSVPLGLVNVQSFRHANK